MVHNFNLANRCRARFKVFGEALDVRECHLWVLSLCCQEDEQWWQGSWHPPVCLQPRVGRSSSRLEKAVYPRSNREPTALLLRARRWKQTALNK